MVSCADTSFLFSLYGNDCHTPKSIQWVSSQAHPLTLSTLNEYELGNALRFAEFRGMIEPGEAARYWADFEADCTCGRLRVEICNLAEIIEEAKRLSASYTLLAGHRGFDILHVAAARIMGARQFLTYDKNQKTLAEAKGLKVPLE